MERNDVTKEVVLSKEDERFWKESDNYALLQEERDGLNYYSIHTIQPILMMSLFDDFDYALGLSNKMIENGVKVFENFSDLLDFAKLKQSQFSAK